MNYKKEYISARKLLLSYEILGFLFMLSFADQLFKDAVFTLKYFLFFYCLYFVWYIVRSFKKINLLSKEVNYGRRL